MKIDKRKPSHWLLLILFGLNCLIGIVARWMLPRRRLVVLYGHKLHGNLLSVYEEIRRGGSGPDVKVMYLTMDPAYRRQLKKEGILALGAFNVLDMVGVCRSAAMVTDHGPHALLLLLKLTDMPFFDVWHGIPFKGFDEEDFVYLRGYRKIFVTSPSMKRMYREKFGFAEEQILVTGYGRTDKLVRGDYNLDALREKYGLKNATGKVVLLAPTWHHDTRTRQTSLFGWDVNELTGRLTEFSGQTGHIFIFRLHLNSPLADARMHKHIRFMSSNDYPLTEELLAVSDVLVSDWSSIVFDFLLLRRPTVFVDSDPPFKKGFSYGPEYRFGPLVKTPEHLLSTLEKTLADPGVVLKEYAQQMESVKREVYGVYADGQAGLRYLDAIRKHALG